MVLAESICRNLMQKLTNPGAVFCCGVLNSFQPLRRILANPAPKDTAFGSYFRCGKHEFGCFELVTVRNSSDFSGVWGAELGLLWFCQFCKSASAFPQSALGWIWVRRLCFWMPAALVSLSVPSKTLGGAFDDDKNLQEQVDRPNLTDNTATYIYIYIYIIYIYTDTYISLDLLFYVTPHPPGRRDEDPE